MLTTKPVDINIINSVKRISLKTEDLENLLNLPSYRIPDLSSHILVSKYIKKLADKADAAAVYI